jgi:cyclophilin family peptidyl-prolyl cis-trans isomerase
MYKYSVEQVYKFYEICKKREYDNYKMLAIINYNAIACGTPADSSKGAREKSKHWGKFIEKLDWDKLVAMAEAMEKPKNPIKMFTKLGFKPPKEKK